MELTDADWKGLVRESYAIEGISEAECKSIFIDWALSLGAEHDPARALEALIARYGTQAPGHPMTAILREALMLPPSAARRGGRKARLGAADGAGNPQP